MVTTVERVRAFNRGWTEVIGLLDHGLLDTEHSLAGARVLFELAQRDAWERLALRDQLGMDASFLTRVLTRLEAKQLVSSSPSQTDGRALDVALTSAGRRASGVLDARSSAQIDGLLAPLTTGQRAVLVESMALISHLLQPEPGDRHLTIRPLQPGDMGWVIQRHGAIYADEFGWNADFEALVARIVADHHTGFEPGRDAAWIAEVDGARAGCVFCCHHTRQTDTAQLRILLVEPWARGQHIGTRLVDECIAFARAAGYTTLTLWTNDVLVAARHIYETAGFVLTDQDPHHSFGYDLVGQHWQLALTSSP